MILNNIKIKILATTTIIIYILFNMRWNPFLRKLHVWNFKYQKETINLKTDSVLSSMIIS